MGKPTFLITGGSGFLGKALARKLKGRGSVVLAARNHARNQIAEEFTGCRCMPLDVSNVESVRDVMTEVKPSVVIHAAASKFVDVSERSPMECVDVNVVGSENVVRACLEHGVETLVGVSTDKAAPPAGNIYGLSKALMERMFGLMNGKGKTRIACVRFGNIAWSTGSVFPIWKRMQTRDGVIGSTGPQMRRFFFSVDEASDLVVRGIDNIESLAGKVLSQKMKSAQVSDLLDVWTRVHGGSWHAIDPRPGDKLDEYLIGPSECECSEELEIDGTPHYVLNFAARTGCPVSDTISSANADRLSVHEMESLLKNEPAEDAR